MNIEIIVTLGLSLVGVTLILVGAVYKDLQRRMQVLEKTVVDHQARDEALHTAIDREIGAMLRDLSERLTRVEALLGELRREG